MCLDYCFVRDHLDQSLLTVCVVRLYPYRAGAAIPCDTKGNNVYAINRLSAFVEACGVQRLVYKCDQESGLDVLIKAAMSKLGKDCEAFAGGVP